MISGSSGKRSIDWFEGDEPGSGDGEDLGTRAPTRHLSPLRFWLPMDASHDRKDEFSRVLASTA
jgi:hypothetical protein